MPNLPMEFKKLITKTYFDKKCILLFWKNESPQTFKMFLNQIINKFWTFSVIVTYNSVAVFVVFFLYTQPVCVCLCVLFSLLYSFLLFCLLRCKEVEGSDGEYENIQRNFNAGMFIYWRWLLYTLWK